MSVDQEFIGVSVNLDSHGLVWHPEIGDEVSERSELNRVSILVDPQGLTPKELRSQFLWLPTTEQLVMQFEARQALIYHAGVTPEMRYEIVLKSAQGMIEEAAASLRLAFAKALQALIAKQTPPKGLH